MKTPPIVALLLALGCAHEEPKNRSWNGLSIRLTLLDARSAIGRPLRVRVDLVNTGSRTMYYDDQNVEWSSFELEGPVKAPGIAPHGQSFGHLKPLEPGRSVVLLDHYDLATEYLIDAAGAWRVRFNSSLHLSETARRGTPDRFVMVSDWVECRIDDAKPPPWMEITRRLHNACRPRWRLSVSTLGAWTVADLRSPDFTLDRPFREVLLRVGPPPAMKQEERLCETRWGDAFFSTEWPALDQAWPDWRSDLRAALARP